MTFLSTEKLLTPMCLRALRVTLLKPLLKQFVLSCICVFCIIYLELPDPPFLQAKFCPTLKKQLKHLPLCETFYREGAHFQGLLRCLHFKSAPNWQMLGCNFPGKLKLGHNLCWHPKFRDGIKPGQWWPCLLKCKCIRKSGLQRKRSKRQKLQVKPKEKSQWHQFASLVLGHLSEHNPMILELLRFGSGFHKMCFYPSNKSSVLLKLASVILVLKASNLLSSIIYTTE